MKLSLAVLACLGLATSADAQSAPSPSVPSRPSTVVIKMFDKAGIDLWAECGWQKMRVTSQFLVDYYTRERPEPIMEAVPFASPQENLAARLDVACGNLLAPGDRKTISSGVKRAKMLALKEKRPAQPGLKDDKVAAYICSHMLAGKYVLTEQGLSEPKPRTKGFADRTKCFLLNSDGSLTNA